MKKSNKQNKKPINTINKTLSIAVLLCLSFSINAASTHRYFYDPTGQLIKSVDSKGIVIEYVYDEVGNRLETKRTETSGLTIFNFSPISGTAGDVITIDGQEFNASPEGNTVTINGTSANVLSASETQLKIEIPIEASNGFIEISVASNTTQSETQLIVIKRPVISAVSPNVIVSSPTEISNVETEVTGFNFNTASFTLMPEFNEPPISINNKTINENGLHANISLTLQIDISGSFTLVAENLEGKSNTFPSQENTITVLQGSADEDNDNLSNYQEILAGTDINNPDSDGDGFMDGDEVSDGSNPNNNQQTPLHILTTFVGKELSIKNNSLVFNVKSSLGINKFITPSISIQNQALSFFQNTEGNNSFISQPISVQNQALSFFQNTEGNNSFISQSISIQNQALSFFQNTTGNNAFISKPVSVQNQVLIFSNNNATSKTISIENQAIIP